MVCSQFSFCMASLKCLILSISRSYWFSGFVQTPILSHYSTSSVCTSSLWAGIYRTDLTLHYHLKMTTHLAGPKFHSPVSKSPFPKCYHEHPVKLLFTSKPAAMALRSWTAIEKAWIKSFRFAWAWGCHLASLNLSLQLCEMGFLPCLVWWSCDTYT